MKKMNNFKILASSLAIASLISFSSVNAITSTYVVGDVNRDGKITLDDCELIKQHIMEEVVLDAEQQYLADVNGDGEIRATDYVKLKNIIEGKTIRFLKGDVNRDGKITNADNTLLLKFYLDTQEYDNEQFYLSDFNENGKIDLPDVIYLIKLISGEEKRFLVGDVTRDGIISQDDVDRIYDHVNGTNPFDDEQIWLGDVNGDTDVTAVDMNMLYAIIRGTYKRFLPGDVNRDNMITSADYELIKQHIMEEVVLDAEQLFLADVDSENGITAADYVKLKNYTTGANRRFDIGDVTRDGVIDKKDVFALKYHLTGAKPFDEEQPWLADVNNDGSVNTADYDALKSSIGYDEFANGDINRDGKVNKEDLTLLDKYLEKESTLDEEQLFIADLDKNGIVSNEDYGYLEDEVAANRVVGDVNEDGVIDQQDLNLITKHINNGAPLEDESLGDLNGDGVVDQKDKEIVEIIVNNNYYLHGDLDENRVVDANDASIALELYKAESATIRNIAIGDMDRNGIIDANDASLILEVYKTNN